MKKLTAFFRRIYRLSTFRKYEDVVWKKLKKFLSKRGYHCGIYEDAKYIAITHLIEENKPVYFYYGISEDGFMYCDAIVLKDFPEELTTDFFIMASHFNNSLPLYRGKVIIDVHSQQVIYRRDLGILYPLVLDDHFSYFVDDHYDIMQDIHWAFDKLVEEQEDPAIVFADLMRMKEEQANN